MKRNDDIKTEIVRSKISLLDYGANPMWIKDIHIRGIAGISDLSLDFKPGLNVICGANGIGKSTILDCINEFFITSSNLKRNVKQDEDSITIHYDSEGCLDESYIDSQGIFISEKNIKNWFVSRYAFVDKKDSISDEKIGNYNLAVKNFSVVDADVSFCRVDGITYDIMLNTPNGEIYFEYLSSGYKTCIYIILGIIKEIEYRFKDKNIKAKDFAGALLIDEVDIHLHPVWQNKLLKALKTIFPLCQIIATTHSPSILQTLEKDEIIALDIDDNWSVYKKELQLGEYGLKGWTLEEILTDVMGLPSTNSDEFEEAIRNFDSAMDSEDYTGLKESFSKLDNMLHPKNTLRKLLQIQMAGMRE